MTGTALLEVAAEPYDLLLESIEQGWGDGLPLIAPTPERVAEFVTASGVTADTSLGKMPPLRGECTVERVATNAVMAGAPPAAMPLILASVKAMLDPAFDLGGINATTNSAIPAIVVNGPVREDLGIPYRHAAFGGVACHAPAIGRAVRLVIRNVGGQEAGVTSEGVFGQPSRTAGIVVGEWEERSPWAPLAERRGVTGSAVTTFGAVGTANIANAFGETGQEILQVIGRSLAYMGNTNMVPASTWSEQMVAINPVWANERIHRDVPSLHDVQEIIWRAARLPIELFPQNLVPLIEERGRIDSEGNVYLMESPEEVHVFVTGGLGSLHAMMLPGFVATSAITRPV